MNYFWQNYQRPIILLIIVLVGLFVYTKVAGPIPFYINSVNTTKTDLFSASGHGEVTAVPDSASVSLGVTGQATTVSEAQNKINEVSNKIITDIKKQGITDKDIKTTNYSVNPNYGSGVNAVEPMVGSAVAPIQRGGSQQIVGYTVTQNIEVKVKPIDKVNKIVDIATADGANLVGGVNFTFSDDLEKSLENKAREIAVDDAKTSAGNLAKSAGIRLGRVVNVVENSNNPRPIAMGAAKLDTSSAQPPTNITPGENTLSVDVILYYETY